MKYLVLLLALLSLGVIAADEVGLRKQRQEAHLIYYAGTIEVTGEYIRRFDDITLDLTGDLLCFFPDKTTGKLIPRGSGDRRLPWFCFAPQDGARAMLKVPSDKPVGYCQYAGTASVVITDYVVNRQESEVADSARLVNVLRSSTPSPVKCQ